MRDRLLLCALMLIVLQIPLTVNAAPVRDLSLAERVEAQRAIERVYHSHMTGTSRSFEESVTPELIERKVRTYLKQSAALEQFWNTPVTAEMLRAEAARIGRNTKFPERLGEIRGALGHDDFLLQESLVRATLVDRLARGFLASDARVQGPARVEADQIHARLIDGTLDPRADHPRRTVRTDTTTGAKASSRLVSLDTSEDRETSPDLDSLQTGQISPVTDDLTSYRITVELLGDSGVSRVATYAVPKASWDAWWNDHAAEFDETLISAIAVDTSLQHWNQPSQSASSCLPDNTWDHGALDDTPDSRYLHVSVWTGTEMIIWGGNSVNAGRYDPLTDTWRGVSTLGAPPMAVMATAVWSGTEMIVWGGYNSFSWGSGARYDPISDTWTQVSAVDEPGFRREHSVVWTGSEMIVWGGLGQAGVTGTGARYDPATDTWRPTSQTGAPMARLHHTAVWTGREMIIWGGEGDDHQQLFLSSGARYDPATDTWTPVSQTNAPIPRSQHTALWANGVMTIWGGLTRFSFLQVVSTGARYDPVTDTWSTTSMVGAPTARRAHTAVSTGTRMIVWGGSASATNLGSPVIGSGASYDSTTDSWQSLSQINAPLSAALGTAVWTGSLMITWGGAYYNGTSFPVATSSGGRYDPAGDSWTSVSRTQGGLPVYGSETIVWTGTEMLAWGYGGGRYDPMTDAWRAMSTLGAPSFRIEHVAVWTGEEMVVWGGYDWTNYFSAGGRYNPVSDSWRPTSLAGAPQSRRYASAVWTGQELIVWGGLGAGFFPGTTTILGTGGRYNPSTDVWQNLPTTQAPPAVFLHTAVWTGQEMIVWGGFTSNTTAPTDRGARYEPATNRWFPLPTMPAGQARNSHTAIWTGSEMILVGGENFFQPAGFRAGWIYARASNTWTPLDPPYPSFPLVRQGHSHVWTGRHMLIWGGDATHTFPLPGIIYDRDTGTWSFMAYQGQPRARNGHSALWTGTSMLVWGGGLATGGRYYLTGGPCNSPPEAAAGSDFSAECSSAMGATVTLDGSGSSDGDSSANTNDDIEVFEWFENYGTPSQAILGSGESLNITLPLGEHLVTLRVTDRAGDSDIDETLVRVLDLTAPGISATPSPVRLWPPNHQMAEVSAAVTAVDNCGPSSISLVSITSNEPDDEQGQGDGRTTGDIQDAQTGTNDSDFLLRAERDASGDGRVYSIVYRAVDTSGNMAEQTVSVVVPHDQGGITQPLSVDLREESSGTIVEWNHVPGALFYNVIRGETSHMHEQGNAIDLGAVNCVEAESLDRSTTGHEDSDLPPPGAAFFYLVEYNDGWASTYGQESVSKPRVVASGGCPQ